MEKSKILMPAATDGFSNEVEPTLPRTLREQYLLEKERIKYEIGDLEQIRISLGYSQRRMCQLLLVDPSAWTRWTKTLAGAPPHVYQSLRWLVELKNINPDAVAPNNIAKRMDFVQRSTHDQLKALKSDIAALERAVALTSNQPASDFVVESILRIQESKWEEKFALLKAKLDALLSSSRNKPRKNKKRTKKIYRKKKNGRKAKKKTKQKTKKRKFKK